MLEQFPEALMVLGLSTSAVQIRKWQRSEVRAFRRIAHAITRRIICTDKAATLVIVAGFLLQKFQEVDWMTNASRS